MHVISAYASQGRKMQEKKEEFWGMMDDSLGIIPENEILVIGGDLNGHVGRDRNGFEDVMEIDGYGERNVNGENILEISQSRQLKILNIMRAVGAITNPDSLLQGMERRCRPSKLH